MNQFTPSFLDDDISAGLMRDFGTAFLAGTPAGRAVIEAQRTWLIRLRNERSAAPAVRLAGPFLMTTRG